MSFNSFIFILLFLPLTVIVFHYLKANFDNRVSKYFILLMSFIFYSYFSLKYLLVLLGISLINFALHKVSKKYKIAINIAIIFDLLSLVYFKFFNFLIDNINFVFSSSINTKQIILPLAYSFFIFSGISFIVDSKDENVTFDTFLIYLFYFPKMIQGPIVLFNDFKDKYNNYCFSNEKLANGITLFIIGLSKKVLLAEVFCSAADFGFSNISSLDSLNLIIVSICYTLQLYFDFSGYTDMAIGVSLMLGISMPNNFNSPYKATSISDFWKRWHITLTKFFTKYVYIPLGGNRKGKARMYINTLIVFAISGLWHGAGWNFVLWGLLNGLLMILDKLFSKRKRCYIFDRIITFVLINCLWIVFRCSNLNNIILFFNRLFTTGFGSLNIDLIKCFNLAFLNLAPMNIDLFILLKTSRFYLFGYVFFGLFITLILKNSEEYISNCKYSKFNVIVLSLLFVWCLLSLTGANQFIYAGF